MRWAIITGTYNAVDLVEPFCRYHLALGVDQIFVSDYGSEDGTLELLQPFISAGLVRLFPLPTHHFVDYDPSNALLKKVREEKLADWVSFLDPDEFLLGPEGVKASLERMWSEGTEALAVPRANLIGIGVIPERYHYLSHLTLKIIATDPRISLASAALPSPWIFSRLPPKVMVRVESGLTVVTGDHDVISDRKPFALSSELEILHFPIRGYDSFHRKVEDTEKYLAANQEFAPGIAWHWRRWIELARSGQLRKEYETQFLAPEVAATLLREKKLVEENRLSSWLRDHSGESGR